MEGSFDIFEKIGPIAYALKLLNDWKIHIVFHVILLRKNVPNPNHVFPKHPKIAHKA